MTSLDTCCTIVPYMRIHPGKEAALHDLCQRMVERTKQEPKCLYYGFTFRDDVVHCREGYVDGEGALAHLDNVADLLEELLSLTDLVRIEVHGPESELAKLREPMAALNPEFYVWQVGFRV